jgi:hypothetical protein
LSSASNSLEASFPEILRNIGVPAACTRHRADGYLVDLPAVRPVDSIQCLGYDRCPMHDRKRGSESLETSAPCDEVFLRIGQSGITAATLGEARRRAESKKDHAGDVCAAKEMAVGTRDRSSSPFSRVRAGLCEVRDAGHETHGHRSGDRTGRVARRRSTRQILAIANRCPVHLTLSSRIEIRTKLQGSQAD